MYQTKSLFSLFLTCQGQGYSGTFSVLFALLVALSSLNATRSLVSPSWNSRPRSLPHLPLRGSSSGPGCRNSADVMLWFKTLLDRISPNIPRVFAHTHSTFAVEDGDLENCPLPLTDLYSFPLGEAPSGLAQAGLVGWELWSRTSTVVTPNGWNWLFLKGKWVIVWGWKMATQSGRWQPDEHQKQGLVPRTGLKCPDLFCCLFVCLFER